MKLVCACLLVTSVASVASLGSVAAAGPANPPTVVTQAWLREMNAAKWPLEPLLDPHQGVIVLERRVDSGDESFKGVVSARRICKASELPALGRQIADYYQDADVFNCANKPNVGCSFALAYEYTTRTSLTFEKLEDGTLRLTLVMFLDGGNQVPAFYEQQEAWVSKQLTKLAKTTCDTR